jgi:hypothetical protein
MTEEKLCEAPVFSRFTWPRQDEQYVCLLHTMKLIEISNGMGMHLQIIPLRIDEMDGKHCSQKIKIN